MQLVLISNESHSWILTNITLGGTRIIFWRYNKKVCFLDDFDIEKVYEFFDRFTYLRSTLSAVTLDSLSLVCRALDDGRR